MPRNVEIKARVRDINGLRARANKLSDTDVEVLRQTDTFYRVPSGRLKLRVFPDRPCELIFYNRADAEGAKTSEYHLVRSDDPETFARILGATLDVRGVVRKTRFLYRIGQTRVHIDDVEGLGTFMELEVVLTDKQSEAEGAAIADDLSTKLGIEPNEQIAGAYIDLLEKDAQ